MRLPATLICALLLSACGRDAAPPAASTDASSPPAATPVPEPTTPPVVSTPMARMPSFVEIPWRAEAGSGVELGTRYWFRSDGTLLIGAPNGTPSQGAWRFVDGALTMTEEGIDYPTDIVVQDADHLHLRSHNPGGAVELLLVRDVGPPPMP